MSLRFGTPAYSTAMPASEQQIVKPEAPPAIEALLTRPPEVHVWCTLLDTNPSTINRLQSVLTPEERCRAKLYQSVQHQNDFIQVRGTLRYLLGHYFCRPPGQIKLSYGPGGKPAVLPGTEPFELRFNLSRSQGLAVFAFTTGRSLGVDVECLRSNLDHLMVARQFFSAREYHSLIAVPLEAQVDSFFHCWTRKEAMLKALGQGLRIPLNSFDVPVAAGTMKCVASCGGREWSLQSFSPSPEYVACVAAEGHAGRLRVHTAIPAELSELWN